MDSNTVKNFNYFCVLDFETDSKHPKSAHCNPIQLACLMVDPRKLEIVPGSEFSQYIKPPGFDVEEYHEVEEHIDTYEFHAEQHECTASEFKAKYLENAPEEKQAWNTFKSYLKSYYKNGSTSSKFNAPILCGYNNTKFDNHIMWNLCEKYGSVDKNGFQNLFHPQFTLDIMHMMFPWQENVGSIHSYRLDTMRKLFKIDNPGLAHEGLKDCRDEADLLIRLLRMNRRFCEQINWEKISDA